MLTGILISVLMLTAPFVAETICEYEPIEQTEEIEE